MKILIVLLFSFNAVAGLPPTSSKISGESVFSTTFKTDYGSLTGTRSGTTLTPNQTGTGSMVLSTSPTLVTPTLGAATGTSLGLGGALASNTILSVSSTSAASIPAPKMTTAQKNAITPASGMAVFDTDLGMLQYYNGSQWVANTNIQLDNMYSALFSSTAGVITSTNKSGWVTNSSYAGGEWTVTFGAGYFTTAPSCTATTSNSGGSRDVRVYSESTTSIKVVTYSSGSTSQDAFHLHCQKQGADYQSTNAYIASNSNYSRTAFTPTFTGFGTPSSVECYHSRDGEFLDMNCSFVAGTTTGVEARVSLPSGLTTTSVPTTRFAAGHYALSSANSFSGEILAQPGQTYITFGQQAVGATATANTQVASTLLSNGTLLTFSARIPISGWTNSNLIVASLQGTPNIPGSTVKVDEIVFDFGTTNATTDCTASPCSYLDQLGSGNVTSVTRTATGTYTVNFPRTYSKLKCDVRWVNNGFDAAELQGFVGSTASSPLSCSNCSTLPIRAINYNLTAVVDVHAGLRCTGEY